MKIQDALDLHLKEEAFRIIGKCEARFHRPDPLKGLFLVVGHVLEWIPDWRWELHETHAYHHCTVRDHRGAIAIHPKAGVF